MVSPEALKPCPRKTGIRKSGTANRPMCGMSGMVSPEIRNPAGASSRVPLLHLGKCNPSDTDLFEGALDKIGND
jgi:hypothetical protein